MRVSILALSALTAVAVMACGGASGGSGKTIADYQGAIASSDVRTGATVYETFCEGCHPGGGEGDGPKITGIAESAAEVRFQVREGMKDMPGFGPGKISDDELEALLAHLVKMGTVKR